MSLPNSSAQLAIGAEKRDDCRRAGAAALALLKAGIRPSDIMTKKAFENAITVVIALGGSTNAVLHLLAIAHSAEVKLSLDDFTPDRQGACRSSPTSGPPASTACRTSCGSAACAPLMKMLLDEGLLHGDCLTVTGKTVAENLQGRRRPTPPTRTSSGPSPTRSSRTATCGSSTATSRPGGAVAKITGKEGLRFSGKAIVFESEETALAAILGGRVKAGHVIVIRNEGPVGGPGHARDAGPHERRRWARASARRSALITDGRFSGGSHGFVVGHITPEAAVGGPLAVVSNGDPITIDAVANTISLGIPAKEIKARLQGWRPKKPKETRGALAKYARLVTSASEGAVTDKDLFP